MRRYIFQTSVPRRVCGVGLPLAALTLCLFSVGPLSAAERASQHAERMFEGTFESRRAYADPFNDVDVDVIFSREGQSWRVPAFWRGGQRWTVRFAPPSPGKYTYHLESTDRTNVDLNGRQGQVQISPYSGRSSVLRHGMIRVSANGHYFEHADGTPFFWLGSVTATLSKGLPRKAFEQLVAKGSEEGYTVGFALTGLDPEGGLAPAPRGEPGCRADPGTAWDPGYERINPQYFDCLDLRIQYLLDHDLVPEIDGAWYGYLKAMGITKMERHWRYVIARYGAYPVVWCLAGEVFDPPPELMRRAAAHHMTDFIDRYFVERGWTEVAKYVRATDPYHHPLTAHEIPPPFDVPLQDETLTDFDTFQSGHYGWASIAAEVGQMDLNYSRTSITKPSIEGEIGGWGMHEEFDRVAFWLSMLNGAAGHDCGLGGGVYQPGAAPVSPYFFPGETWQDGLARRGPYQVGLGAKLLRQYRWWRIQPHPDWVTPRGTTLLEPHKGLAGFDLGSWEMWALPPDQQREAMKRDYPGGEWAAERGTIDYPYAAGIPGEVRFIYLPYVESVLVGPTPTVLRLETGVQYHAYYWMPSTGIKFDLGTIERPAPGATIFQDEFDNRNDRGWWSDQGHTRAIADHGVLSAIGDMIKVLRQVTENNVVLSVHMSDRAGGGLLLRYLNPDNYIAAIYSAKDGTMYILDRKDGSDGEALGLTSIPNLSNDVTLSAEVRDGKAIAEISDGRSLYSTPIIDVTSRAGSVGLLHQGSDLFRTFADFEVHRSPTLVKDQSLQVKLYDARGIYWGSLVDSEVDTNNPYHQMDFDYMKSANWANFAKRKHILLDAWQPERLPSVYGADWLLVLETKGSQQHSRR